MTPFTTPCETADAVHAVLYPAVSIGRQPRYEQHADLHRDLGLDALDLVSAACELDEALGIELPDAAIEGWVTVADVVASVELERDRNRARSVAWAADAWEMSCG